MKLIRFRSQAEGAFKLGIEMGEIVYDLSSRFMTIRQFFEAYPDGWNDTSLDLPGTPYGVGGFRKIFLKQGDLLRVEVETVGVLQNPVVDA